MPKLVETFVDELDLQGQTETRQFQIVTNAIKHAGLFQRGLSTAALKVSRIASAQGR
jgi:hypothetical protein